MVLDSNVVPQSEEITDRIGSFNSSVILNRIHLFFAAAYAPLMREITDSSDLHIRLSRLTLVLHRGQP